MNVSARTGNNDS